MTTFNILTGSVSGTFPNYWQSYGGDWIGVDRGAITLLDNEIIPKIAVGDFDSNADYDDYDFSVIEKTIKVDAVKDDTDTELAVKTAIENGADQINIFAFSGGRIDHELSNLFFVLKDEFRNFAEKITLIDQQNEIKFLTEKKNLIKLDPKTNYLGFMNMTPIKNWSIKDALYELDNKSLDYPVMYSSNEFNKKDITVTFDSGVVMMVESKDLS